MENLKNIAVIYGGSSSEREISLQSGSGIYEAVRALGHESSLIDFNDLIDLTELKNNDLIFIALHGFEGEGGGLQKKLDELNIPFTGSRSSACVNTWNKRKSKEILDSLTTKLLYSDFTIEDILSEKLSYDLWPLKINTLFGFSSKRIFSRVLILPSPNSTFCNIYSPKKFMNFFLFVMVL